MRAPAFWSNPPEAPGWQAHLLAPAAMLWRLGAALRGFGARAYRAPVPVLCVGNLTAGGTGKTPMVAALASRFARHDPHVVSRGHGGSRAGPHRVDPTDSHAEVGDEPLLLARQAPVWIARDRAAGVRAAVEAGAGLILLDDGFQNPSVVKDAAMVMVDAGAGFGNGRLIPAGPLREPVAAGLGRADLTVLVGPEEARAAVLARWPEIAARPHVGAELVPRATGLAGARVLAFAGIGRPAKFFETLAALGADLAGTRAFPDHHPYTKSETQALAAEAARLSARLVTTEKDALRLPPGTHAETLPVDLVPTDWAPLDALIARLVA